MPQPIYQPAFNENQAILLLTIRMDEVFDGSIYSELSYTATEDGRAIWLIGDTVTDPDWNDVIDMERLGLLSRSADPHARGVSVAFTITDLGRRVANDLLGFISLLSAGVTLKPADLTRILNSVQERI